MARTARRDGRRPSRQATTVFRFELLEARTLLSASTFTSDRFALPAAATSASYYTPAQIRHAYGFDAISFGGTAADGRGQTIAIIDAYDDPNIASDLTAFDKAYGIAAPPSFKIVNQNGGSTLPRTDPAQGWEGEIALDVEWAHAIAPGANILLVEANSASDTDLFAAVNYARNQPGVSVISMSWGSNDSAANRALDQRLSQTYLATPSGHQGITFVAATGDHGQTGFPATSPSVLAVGGTDLYLTASGAISSETAWNSETVGGTVWSGGGGTSVEFAGRNTPDVSYDAGIAFDVYDTFGPDHGWVGVGGTSAGAPQWAALVAIANQGRALRGLSSLDGASQTLPAIDQFSSADFHDITTGRTQTQSAGVGYDLATGRGSPVANLVIADLSGWSTTTVTPTAPSAPGNFTAKAISTSQVTLGWSASTGATGYSIYQQINGQAVFVGSYGATTTTVTLGSLAAGTTYTYEVVATSAAGSAASSWIDVTTQTAAALAAPNVTATTVSTNVARLSWTGVTGATGYTISYLNGAQVVQLGQVSAATTSVNISGLASGSTYSFRVTAFNATTSSSSAWVTIATPAALAVAAPANVTAVALSSTTGQLSWSASAGATGYEILWRNGNRVVLIGNVSVGTTSVTIRGLTPGSTNAFEVVAYNATSTASSNWIGLTTSTSSIAARAMQSSLLADLAMAMLTGSLKR